MDFSAMIAKTNAQNHFMCYNHMYLHELREDYAEVSLEVGKNSLNLFGSIHGGVLYTMADCAAGCVARSRGIRHVTLDTNFQFVKATANPHVRAIAQTKHRGRSICLVSVDVFDGDDVLLASGQFTMFSTGIREDGCED